MGVAGDAGTRGGDHYMVGERAARRGGRGGRPERREASSGGEEESGPAGGDEGCRGGRGALMNQFKCMR